MHVSPSTSAGGTSNTLPSRSRSSQLPITPYGRDGSLAPTTPHHHLQPSHSFLPCPHAIPTPPPSAAHIPSEPIALPHQGTAGCPGPCSRPCTHAQLHSLCRSKRASHPGGSSGTTRADAHTSSTTIHARTTWTRPPPSHSASIPATPSSRRAPRQPYLQTQPTQTAPTPTCACPSDGRSAARPTAVRISLTITRARRHGTTPTDLGIGSATNTALANRAALGALPSGWEMRMTSTQAHLLRGPQHAHDYVGRPAAALDGRRGRTAV
jgi:hypothetical protein